MYPNVRNILKWSVDFKTAFPTLKNLRQTGIDLISIIIPRHYQDCSQLNRKWKTGKKETGKVCKSQDITPQCILQGVPEKLFRKCCSALATSYSAAVMKVNLFVLYIDHSTFLLPTKWLDNRCWKGRQARARSEMSFRALA